MRCVYDIIRELQLGKELVYPEEGGEIIYCPECNAIWYQSDDDYHECEHLRFVFYADIDYLCPGDNFVFFTESWDHEAFEKQFNKLHRRLDAFRAFERINSPDVDEVAYWIYEDPPGPTYGIFFGYEMSRNLLKIDIKL